MRISAVKAGAERALSYSNNQEKENLLSEVSAILAFDAVMAARINSMMFCSAIKFSFAMLDAHALSVIPQLMQPDKTLKTIVLFLSGRNLSRRRAGMQSNAAWRSFIGIR